MNNDQTYIRTNYGGADNSCKFPAICVAFAAPAKRDRRVHHHRLSHQ